MVLDVVVSRALLSSEITCFWWAVLEKREKGQTYIKRTAPNRKLEQLCGLGRS
jgi:hypothetical protein